MSYIPKTVTDANGNPVQVAVRDDEPPPPWLAAAMTPAAPAPASSFASFSPEAAGMMGMGAQAPAPALPPSPEDFALEQQARGYRPPATPEEAQARADAIAAKDAARPRSFNAEQQALTHTKPGPAFTPGAPPAPEAFAQQRGGQGPSQGTGGSGSAGIGAAVSTSGYGGGGYSLPRAPNDEKGLNAAYAGLGERMRAEAELGAKRAAAEVGYAQEQTRLMEQQQADRADFEKRRQADVGDSMKRYTDALDEASRVNTTIDPNRFWASKTTGQRILAGLSIAAGYLGRGQQHNQALEYIQQAISQDIDAQKSMVEYQLRKGNEKVAGAQTLYGMMRQRFNDDASALAATQAAAIGIVQQKLSAMAATYKAPEMQAAAEKAIAGLGVQKQAAEQTLHQQQFDNATKRVQLAQENEKLGMEREKFRLEIGLKAQKAAKELPPEALDRLGGYDAAQKIFANLQESYQKKTGVFSLLSKHLPGTQSGQYEAERQAAAETAARAISGGRPTPGLMEAILDLMPSASTPSGAAANQFRTLQEDNATKRSSDVHAYQRGGYNVSGFAEQPKKKAPDFPGAQAAAD